MAKRRTSFVGAGWSVYILECADGKYLGGMTRNMKRVLAESNTTHGRAWFLGHPERCPVKVAFVETGLPFRQALAKREYIKEMNRKLREKLIRTRKWPLGGSLREYIMTAPFEEIFENR